MSARDPRIRQHGAQKLRWFAGRFRQMADDKRKSADALDDKAKRYERRAKFLDKKDV